MSFDKNEFHLANLSTRMAMLNSYGTELTAIDYFAYKIKLYQIEKNLLEVFVDTRNDSVQYIGFFDMNEVRVKLYSSTVDISKLFK